MTAAQVRARASSARLAVMMASPVLKTGPSRESPVVGLLRGLAWILTAVAAVPTRADPDLWGNLRFGLDIIASRHIGEADQYSFTQDIPWINHEWLAQVMMAASYQLGGTPALVGLKTALVLLTLGLVTRVFHGARPLVAEGAMMLVLWGSLALTGTIRAQLWSFAGLAMLLWLLSRGGSRALWYVPVLFAVWVNCHIGWVIGLAVLGWWAVGTMARGDPSSRFRPAAVVGGSLLATLVNPYGWKLWQFTAGATHLSRGITEWQPLWTTPMSNWVPWLLAVALGVSAIVSKPRLSAEWAVCALVLGYVSAGVVKFAPFFVEFTVLVLAPVVRARWPEPPATIATPPAVRLVNGAAIAICGAAAMSLSAPSFQCLPADRQWRPDASAARALIDGRAQGRIAVWFDWGEYVIWHLGPGLRVSFDPRYDLLYSAAAIDEQSQLAQGTAAGVAFIERTRPEYLWYPQSKAVLKHWVAANGYRLDVDTRESFVAVRADLRPLTPSGALEFGCFPAP